MGNSEVNYEITGNHEVGFYVFETIIGYSGRCQSSSYISDESGMKKRFDSKEEAEQLISSLVLP